MQRKTSKMPLLYCSKHSLKYPPLLILPLLNAHKVDPNKMAEESDENLNVILLQLMCQKFITQITRSSSQVPWYAKIVIFK